MSSDSSQDFDSQTDESLSFDNSSSSSESSLESESSATSSSSSSSESSASGIHLNAAAAMSPVNGSGFSRSSSSASSIPPSEHSNEHNDSSATEDYDLPEIEMRNGDVIDLSSTQFMTQMPVDVEAEEDDDVVLIPQHIETIDLCSENMLEPRLPPVPLFVRNEVIEIEDSPAASARHEPRVIRPERRHPTRTSPYQNEAAAVRTKTPPKARNLNLDDSHNDSQSERVKITCPICFDSSMKKKLVSTKCGHIHCEDCLKLALRSVKKCPMCRKNLPGKDAYHPIFFSSH